ncbi:MAG: 2-oxoacid:ferredoxin oxidoreductase subunit beta, partial [Planctomycetota bacterium]
NIFNHKAWFYASQKDTRADSTVELEHGKPLIFGAERNKGLKFNGARIEVVELGGSITEDDLIHHDETDCNLAFMLARLEQPDFPEPLGILYRDDTRATYEALVHEQVGEAIEAKGAGDLEKLLHEADTWEVE